MAAEPESIDQRLSALRKKTLGSWPAISKLLNDIEQSRYWAPSYSSFTEWLKGNAKAFGYTQSALWRYLVAGRNYEKISTDLPGQYPPLDKAPSYVSPESMEILLKISRVVADEAYRSLAQKVMNGSITRLELRDKWKAYRQALDGKTARGLGVSTPKIDRSDHGQYQSMLEGMVFDALQTHGSNWLGHKSSLLYKPLLHTNVDAQIGKSVRRLQFDAVVLFKSKPKSNLEIHGIEIAGMLTPGKCQRLADQSTYCDYMWLAFHSSFDGQDVDEVPGHVGIIAAGESGISMIRPAKKNSKKSQNSEALLKGILLQVLGK